MSNHLTWLDFYIDGAWKRLSESAPEVVKKYQVVDDIEAAYWLAMSSNAQITIKGPNALDRMPHEDAARFIFNGLIQSFCLPLRKGYKGAQAEIARIIGEQPFVTEPEKCRGIKLSPRLMRSFRGANAPATSDFWPLLRDYAWYIDLPDREATTPAGQIKAIFCQPTSGGIGVMPIVCADNWRIIGRWSWVMPQSGHEGAPPIGASTRDVDLPTLQAQVENLIRLCMLYMQTAESQHREPLPRANAKDVAQKKPHKRRSMLRRFSLFHIEELSPPAGNFGQRQHAESADSNQKWFLGHRVTVRGHFRWQPYGEHRAKRKLIWIDEFDKGPDIEKPTLKVLRRPHEKS